MFDRPVIYALNDADKELDFRIEPADEHTLLEKLSTEEIGVAKWVQKNNKHAGATTNTLPDSKWLFLSVRGTRGVMGIVGVPIAGYVVPDAFEKNLMVALLESAASARSVFVWRRSGTRSRSRPSGRASRPICSGRSHTICAHRSPISTAVWAS